MKILYQTRFKRWAPISLVYKTPSASSHISHPCETTKNCTASTWLVSQNITSLLMFFKHFFFYTIHSNIIDKWPYTGWDAFHVIIVFWTFTRVRDDLCELTTVLHFVFLAKSFSIHFNLKFYEWNLELLKTSPRWEMTHGGPIIQNELKFVIPCFIGSLLDIFTIIFYHFLLFIGTTLYYKTL